MLFSTLHKYAMSLPGVTEQPHHEYGSFRVRGKIFITFPPDHRHVHVFIPEEDRVAALAMYPDCTEELLWGGRVVGVRVSLREAEAQVVKRLVLLAWETKAPRALRAAHIASHGGGTGAGSLHSNTEGS